MSRVKLPFFGGTSLPLFRSFVHSRRQRNAVHCKIPTEFASYARNPGSRVPGKRTTGNWMKPNPNTSRRQHRQGKLPARWRPTTRTLLSLIPVLRCAVNPPTRTSSRRVAPVTRPTRPRFPAHRQGCQWSMLSRFFVKMFPSTLNQSAVMHEPPKGLFIFDTRPRSVSRFNPSSQTTLQP